MLIGLGFLPWWTNQHVWNIAWYFCDPSRRAMLGGMGTGSRWCHALQHNCGMHPSPFHQTPCILLKSVNTTELLLPAYGFSQCYMIHHTFHDLTIIWKWTSQELDIAIYCLLYLNCTSVTLLWTYHNQNPIYHDSKYEGWMILHIFNHSMIIKSIEFQLVGIS